MSAAIQAGIPFGVKFAHIHGGETTLGAIDNIYRHQITLASVIHFASTAVYKKKIESYRQ
jgi:GDP/UDP-N,N'-diacetylbacillosamine 2-epimerase (hydrolysing)